MFHVGCEINCLKKSTFDRWADALNKERLISSIESWIRVYNPNDGSLYRCPNKLWSWTRPKCQRWSLIKAKRGWCSLAHHWWERSGADACSLIIDEIETRLMLARSSSMRTKRGGCSLAYHWWKWSEADDRPLVVDESEARLMLARSSLMRAKRGWRLLAHHWWERS